MINIFTPVLDGDIIKSISTEYLENPARFADLINGYIYHGREVVKSQDVRELNRSIARITRAKGRKLEAQVITADIMKGLTIGVRTVVIALENQTDIHYAMPVRVMNLESSGYHNQWRDMAKQHRSDRDLVGAEYLSGFAKEDRLIPIVTIVVYFGKKPWDGPVSLREMLSCGFKICFWVLAEGKK